MEVAQSSLCTQNIDPKDRLLKLIEQGDAAIILSEENLQNCISELLKFELIVIKNDHIYLTEIGKTALIVGVEKALTDLKSKKATVLAIPVEAGPKKINTSNVPYYILLILGILLMLLIQFFWQ
ncbi:hypothetical protein LZ575_05490 [Antarcticibacterium sp. 1MA-6-2]|uniref:hypothetical protein n=1 Tax=Antarcticibacterium sp. 1MA-6-2 TaxID=2908210 RepID=UPI001F35F386|nr:hypothetical protein [Antarcticibacterium sp. 1MA-6-2]UJH92059.1 hypothetical protein LZ575_05490 [Antarcticibacterium sp. 1MA-6-2]